MSNFKHFESKAVRTQSDNSLHREHSTPIFMTSSFTFENVEQAKAMFADEVDGNIYTRFTNPNNNEFTDKLCLLEGAESGIATASGMAAMFSSMAGLLKSGDHVLASRSVFGIYSSAFHTGISKMGDHTYLCRYRQTRNLGARN